MSAPYQNHYGIHLLDDIHNYFPAILYEPESFRSVTELLQYIRQQTRNRFDLFSAGLAAHNEHNGYHPRSTQVVPSRTTIRPREPVPLTTMIFSEPQEDVNTVSMRILRELLLPATQPLPLMQPVVVRPTEQQIATATTVETVVDEGEMCAICQDTIATGTQVRTLNVCDHSFHTGCIDTWFTTNVRCPVCRHDIREEE
jgi:hypothetical protein